MSERVKPDPLVQMSPRARNAAAKRGSLERTSFVALISPHSGKASEGVSIRDAWTGEVTDHVKPPVDAGHFTRVTSLGMDTYVLMLSRSAAANQRVSSTHQKISGEALRAYRLKVDAAGKVKDVRPFPESLLPHACKDIAGSPNGAMLAYAATNTRNRSLTSEVGLTNLTTHGRHSMPLTVSGSISSLSWAGDSATLAFEWHSVSRSSPSGIYVADLSSADWVSQGRVVVNQDQPGFDFVSPVISADAQAVYATIAEPEPTGGPHWTRLVEIPIGRRPPRTLFELRYEANSYNLHYMWELICRDRTGRYLLVFTAGYVYRIEISSGIITRLPFPEGRPYAAAW